MLFLLLIWFLTPLKAGADELALVKAYADVMITHGRDTYGRKASPLFATTLDRSTRELIDPEDAPVVLGLTERERTIAGANPMQDQNLYQILYALTALTRESRYAEEADAALTYFFETCQNDQTSLLAWGMHMGWDFHQERFIRKLGGTLHAFSRPWAIWDISWALSPKAALRFAKGLWDHQIGDQETGNFGFYAVYDQHGPGVNRNHPRHAGFYLATWAHAVDELRDDRYLKDLSLGTWSLVRSEQLERTLEKALEKLLTHVEQRQGAETGAIAQTTGVPTKTQWWHGRLVRPVGLLSLAVDLEQTAAMSPSPLSDRMRELSGAIDVVFLKLPHDPKGKGFWMGVDVYTLETFGPEASVVSTAWFADGDRRSHAEVANVCAERFRQTKNDAYRSLVMETAAAYLEHAPTLSEEGYPGVVQRLLERVTGGETAVYPVALGQAIKLMLNAYGLTSEPRYLARAGYFAETANRVFLAGEALPRATHRNDHYEAATGGDALMMALLELWTVKQGRRDEVSLVWVDR